jgi:hypothetical protein
MTACENAEIREAFARRGDNECRRRTRLREPTRWALSIRPADRAASSTEVVGTSICGAVDRPGWRKKRRTHPGRGTPCGYTSPPRAEE